MRKQQIQNAAFDVASQVRSVEDSLDATLIEVTELQGAMIRARQSMGIGIITGQSALHELAATLSSLVAARGTIGKCHSELKDATRLVPGLRETGMGDGQNCPPKTAEAAPDLRIVA